MAARLVADRFLSDGSGRWRDLVTGESVAISLRARPRDERRAERILVERLSDRRSRHPLIDGGRVGVAGWFEARATTRRPPPARPVIRVEAAVAGAVAEWAGGRRDVGIQVVRVALPRTWARYPMACAMARGLRGLGFVALRGGATVDRALSSWFTHRHLAVFLLDRRDRVGARSWVAALVRASYRTHLMLDVRPGDYRTHATVFAIAPEALEAVL